MKCNSVINCYVCGLLIDRGEDIVLVVDGRGFVRVAHDKAFCRVKTSVLRE